MEELFGISMNSIMVVLLVLLGLCLLVVAFIAWRRPVIFKLGVRSIPRRKAQTTLIVVGLMLATLIIAAALGTGDTLNHSVSSSVYEQLGPVDELVVHSDTGDGEGETAAVFTSRIPESTVGLVQEAAAEGGNVDAVGGILVSQAPVINAGAIDPATVTSPTQLIDTAKATEPNVSLAGINVETYNALGGVQTLAGERFDFASLPANGAVLNESGAEDLDAEVGDVFVFTVNNQPQFVTVSAIAPDSVLTGTLNPNSPSMVMQLSALQQLLNASGEISAVGISNAGGEREGVELTEEVSAQLRSALRGQPLGVVEIKQDNVDIAEDVANIFVTFFIIFGLFSIAVGILLIVLIFTMLAAERRSEMGMERAVGAQRRQLIQQFIAEGTGYSLLSGLVGVILGALASIGIAYGMRGIFGDFLQISPYVSLRSMIVAYCLGVVITFLAVSISSWRVSRLNIVAAVRDIPDAYRALKNRRQLIWGILMIVAGALLTWVGVQSETLFPFTSGMTLLPFGVAAIVTYFGVKPRWVLTVTGLYVLVFWLLPDDQFAAIFGEYTGDIEMFFLSGICIVAASTLVIMQNLDALLSIAEHFGARFRGTLPAIRLAVSYPGANKGRTGMTVAMFSLIVFSLVVVAAINENFASAFLGDEANAGWEVQVTIPSNNPVEDFTGALEASGVDTSAFEQVGTLQTPDQYVPQFRNPGETEWTPYPISGMGENYIDQAELSFQARATGYASDEEILEALRTDPNVAVIDAFAVGPAGFGGPPGFRVEDVTIEDGTFEAPTIQVQGADGQPQEITIIGVIEDQISSLFGIYTSVPGLDRLFPQDGPRLTNYYIRLTDGVDPEPVARNIERALLVNGAQAVDIEQELEEAQQSQASFLYILEGFMGLGLIVGIAAVGVIAFRAVVERRQQIGMLRALGFQRSTVAQAFVIESAVVVILGVFSGGILGLILSYNLMTGEFFTEGGSGVDFIVPWTLIIITLLAAVIAALLMAWLPARQASRVIPAEALRYE